MNQKDRFTKAKVVLLVDQPWFGQLACYIQPRLAGNIPTACINERGDLFYNEKFIATLTQLELKTVLCHEILHLAFQHPFRVGSRNPMIWNLAADLKVNEELTESMNFKLPKGSLIPDNGEWTFANKTIKDIPNKSTEVIYDEMMKIVPPSVRKLLSGSIEVVFGKGQGKSGLDKLPEPWRKLFKDLMKDLVKADKRMSEKGFDVPKSEYRALGKEWRGRVNQANQNTAAGHIPAGVLREIRELEAPELPWHQIIRQRLATIARRRSWQKPAKKFLPFFFPGAFKEKGLNAVVAIDTSGSMGDDDITKAISEIVGLAESFPAIHLWILANDAKVWDIIEVKNGNKRKIKEIVPRGGGGTQFGPVFKKIKEDFRNRIDCLIFFTDGYLSDPWPQKPRYQVYWVTQSSDVKWPYGRVIRLKSED